MTLITMVLSLDNPASECDLTPCPPSLDFSKVPPNSSSSVLGLPGICFSSRSLKKAFRRARWPLRMENTGSIRKRDGKKVYRETLRRTFSHRVGARTDHFEDYGIFLPRSSSPTPPQVSTLPLASGGSFPRLDDSRYFTPTQVTLPGSFPHL